MRRVIPASVWEPGLNRSMPRNNFFCLLRWAGGLAAFLAWPGFAGAAETVQARLLYVTLEEVYLDMGSSVGLTVGDVGTVYRDRRLLGRVVLTDVTPGSSRARVATRLELPLQAGDAVTLEPKGRPDIPPAFPDAKNTKFVPLLAPWKDSPAPSRARDLFHGVLRVRHLMQNDPENRVDYGYSRADLNALWDRVGGSSWLVQGDGNVTYRDGPAFAGSPDYREVRVDLYRFDAQRPLDSGGFFRMGRFIPFELSPVGLVDGMQMETRSGQGWRFGGLAGTRPQGTEQSLSGDAPAGAAYVARDTGSRGGVRSQMSGGLFTQFYQGDWDRLSLLWEQRLDFFSRAQAWLGLEEDFRVNGSTVMPETQLTRLNAGASWSALSILTFRGGADRYRRPDTLEDRALQTDADQAVRDPGYWRYWVGAVEFPVRGVSFDQELSVIDDFSGYSDPLWRAGVQSVLPGWRGAQAGLQVYNLAGSGLSGVAALVSATLPVERARLVFAPSCRLRRAGWEGEEKSWEAVDLSLRADWRGRLWGLFGAFTRTDAEISKIDLWEIGTDVRW